MNKTKSELLFKTILKNISVFDLKHVAEMNVATLIMTQPKTDQKK